MSQRDLAILNILDRKYNRNMKQLTEDEKKYVEGNKHIIRFEGFKIFESNGYENVIYDEDNVRCLVDTWYHKKENHSQWLKPVFKLIRSRGFKIKCNVDKGQCTISNDFVKFRSPSIEYIEDYKRIWICVIEFCRWYNARV